jgi:copper resistance protein C
MRDPVISKSTTNPQPHPEESAKNRRVGKAKRAHLCVSPGGGHGAQRARLCPPYIASTLSALLLFPLGVGVVHAHAFLDHADPRVGNTVKSPRIVSLWFTQNLESSFSTIEVLDSNGARMNVGNALVDTNDRKLLRVPVKVLPAGTYTVKWHVLSVDTHTTEGNFTFHVGQ